MVKKKKKYDDSVLGWYHENRDNIVAAVPSRTRKKLIEDKEYRGKILAFIKQTDNDERYEYCREHDLCPSTMSPWKYCGACGRKTEYSCDCTDDRW